MGTRFSKSAIAIAIAAALGSVSSLNAQQVEEQVVTGSFLATGDTSTSPLEIIDGDKLQEVPRSTLADFLFADVPQNIAQDSGIETGGTQGRLDGNRNASINLRGIGKENSLIIVDDVKIVPYAVPDGNGWQSVDVNSALPRIAVKRSEILLDGGSAIYGTDAVAGVLNLIPDFGFNGVQLQGTTQNYEEDMSKQDYSFGAKWGFSDGETDVLLAMEHARRDNVTESDIGIADIDYDLSEGIVGPNTSGFFTFRGASGNTTYADPTCGNAEALDVDPVFAQTVVGANTTSESCGILGAPDSTLQTELELNTLFAGVRKQLTDRLNVTLSGSYNETDTTDHNAWTTFTVWNPATTGPSSGHTIIPPTNPASIYNEMIDPAGPWQGNVRFNGRSTGSAFTYNDELRTTQSSYLWRGLIKAEYQLTESWDALLTTTASRSFVDVGRRETSTANMLLALQQGLGGPNCSGTVAGDRANGCYWYNPYMSAALPNAAEIMGGIDNPPELIDWLYPVSSQEYDARLQAHMLLLRGSLEMIALPGGPVGLAVGYEYRKDELSADYDSGYNNATWDRITDPIPDYSGSIDVDSWVAELSMPFTDDLNVQAAVRYEDYSSGFTTTNPKVGFNWTPTDAWTLRASWGTSFKAPSVEQTQASTIFNPSFAIFGDPADPDFVKCPNGRQHCTVKTLTNVISANPELKPQESTNWSAGFDWRITDNLSFGATFVDIDFENVIDIPSASEKLRSVCLDTIRTGTDGFFVGGATGDGQDGYIDILVPIISDACFSGDPASPSQAFVAPLNLGFRNIQAVDLNLNWTIETDFGSINLRPNGTILLQWDEQTIPGGEVEDLVGGRTRLGSGYSEYRANVPVSWEMGAHRLTLTGRFISGLEDSAGVDPWDDYYQADLNYRLALTDSLTLAAFVNNLTDEQPDSNASNFPRDGRRLGLSVDWTYGD